ncbi:MULTISPECIES: dickkopf-related protein [Anaeromyxobacter]|uniref:dickkopf-related protein n=1 Tax=Anaeromyxobacter TaxID=161492 RepID=UPI001F59C857|nr:MULTISPECIES: dickkopf-related protein [unclassified Anaeromyxobacter]
MTSKRIALSFLLLAAACSSSGGGDPGGGGGPGGGSAPATVSEYCDAYWGAYAARWAACERASAAEAAAVFAPAARCADPVQAVAAGRATYDGARAGACLSFLETASCDVLEAFMNGTYPQADCGAAVAGKLADGQACFSDESCASGVCLWSPDACPSTCWTPIPSGSPCESGLPCAAGTSCNILLATPVCTPLAGVDGPCLNDIWCGPGLFCQWNSYYDSKCRPRATSGSCTRDEECAIGYRCSSASTCVAWRGPGESCTQGENACGPGLYCSAGGTCVDGPKPSELCSNVNGEGRPCIGGWCSWSGVAYVCTAWRAPGETCSLQSQCRPTDVCDYASSGQCTTLCAEP